MEPKSEESWPEEAWDQRLTRPVRYALALLGLLSVLAALAVGFLAFFVVGISHAHHSSHSSFAESAWEPTFLLFPVLLLSFGVVALICVDRKRLFILAAVGAVAIAEGVAALYLARSASSPDESRYIAPAIDPAPGAMIAP